MQTGPSPTSSACAAARCLFWSATLPLPLMTPVSLLSPHVSTEHPTECWEPEPSKDYPQPQLSKNLLCSSSCCWRGGLPCAK